MTGRKRVRCFTHDLDFGRSPRSFTRAFVQSFLFSVPRNMPEQIGEAVRLILREHRGALALGALPICDEGKSRLRLLPLGQRTDCANRVRAA